MGESEEFIFEARAPQEPGDYIWTTTQTYKDGSVVEWSGPVDSERPAPTVRVVASASETTSAGGHEHGEGDHGHSSGEGHDEHSSGEGDHEHGVSAQGESAGDGGGSLSPYLMAVAGLIATSAVIGGLVFLRGRA